MSAEEPRGSEDPQGEQLSPLERETFAKWQAEIDAELAKPGKAEEPRDPEQEERKKLRSGLVMGGVAAVLSFTALPFVAALPAGLLLLDGGMAYGFYCLLRVLCKWRGVEPGDAFIAALIPVLSLHTLLGFLAAEKRWLLPLGLRYTVALTVLLLACASLVLVGLAPSNKRPNMAAWRRRCAVVGWLSLAGAVALFLDLALNAPPPQRGTWPTFALTVSTVSVALLLQGNVHRFGVPWLRRFASAPALALAATQLLDGAVSYLAVGNPFGLLAHPSQEQMAVSAFLIQWTGPGYVLAKWGLALLVVMALDRRDAGSRVEDPFHRAMVYLVVAYVGMGPAIFSTVRLFL